MEGSLNNTASLGLQSEILYKTTKQQNEGIMISPEEILDSKVNSQENWKMPFQKGLLESFLILSYLLLNVSNPVIPKICTRGQSLASVLCIEEPPNYSKKKSNF